jgi:hypothetical protein
VTAAAMWACLICAWLPATNARTMPAHQALPVYKKLWELVWSTGNTLQDSWPAKKFMQLGYPVLAPLADPLCSNVSNSKYLKQLETHLKPL